MSTVEGSNPNHMYIKDEKLIFRSGWLSDFYPQDWRIRHTIYLKWSPDMIIWLEENIDGWWQLEGWQVSKNGIIKFSRGPDAMAFKLRWL